MKNNSVELLFSNATVTCDLPKLIFQCFSINTIVIYVCPNHKSDIVTLPKTNIELLWSFLDEL